jgi:CRP/FNR family transcriptional regulator, dissimilatory nitrate respiration regulator
MHTTFASQAGSFSQSSTVRFLDRLPLFEGLESETIIRLARGAAEVRLAAGSILFRQGTMPAALYVIVDGQVKLSLQTARGDEKVIELLGRGENFGAVPVLLGERHALGAETVAESVLLPRGRNAVLEELERNPRFCSRMLREVCQRLQQRTRDFENCMLLNGAQRVTTFLLSRIPDGVNGRSVAVTLPAKKGIIASRLNLTHEHFSRILHDIQAAGLIEVRGREIRMIDVGRLRAYPG